jgi:hypothetical protein
MYVCLLNATSIIYLASVRHFWAARKLSNMFGEYRVLISKTVCKARESLCIVHCTVVSHPCLIKHDCAHHSLDLQAVHWQELGTKSQ